MRLMTKGLSLITNLPKTQRQVLYAGNRLKSKKRKEGSGLIQLDIRVTLYYVVFYKTFGTFEENCLTSYEIINFLYKQSIYKCFSRLEPAVECYKTCLHSTASDRKEAFNAILFSGNAEDIIDIFMIENFSVVHSVCT
ncbi:CLUMA_CG014713, isoform A [Clunio marinus]|uniref:CLUMA_CG014713, isoform A n=1 Tax=Clunio marinus TaxID=568069 RepID=A0A1J1IMM5_9DIPT|nr:CLUMA_CG014713, isoform A [Clunio marinus]